MTAWWPSACVHTRVYSSAHGRSVPGSDWGELLSTKPACTGVFKGQGPALQRLGMPFAGWNRNIMAHTRAAREQGPVVGRCGPGRAPSGAGFLPWLLYPEAGGLVTLATARDGDGTALAAAQHTDRSALWGCSTERGERGCTPRGCCRPSRSRPGPAPGTTGPSSGCPRSAGSKCKPSRSQCRRACAQRCARGWVQPVGDRRRVALRGAQHDTNQGLSSCCSAVRPPQGLQCQLRHAAAPAAGLT